MADEERTEQPTPKRRTEARNKGNVARSRDLSAAFVLLVGLGSLALWGPGIVRRIMEMLKLWLGGMKPGMVGSNQIAAIFTNFSLTLAGLVAPILFCVSIAALAANYVQVGWIFSTDRLSPDLSRLLKMEGLKRFFSLNSLVEMLKNLAKISLIGLVAYYSVAREIPNFIPLLDQDILQTFNMLGSASFRVCIRIMLALLVLGVFDFYYQRYRTEKSLKMTKQEVKDEMRQTEGDPKVKARMKSLMRQMALKNMISQVPKADVVITNPTHVAVALKYDSANMLAPQVIAKGKGFIALKIIAAAQEAGVPRVENRPLARSLYKMVEVGQTIPTELFRAVAEVLAYIYKLQGKTQGGVK